MPMVFWVPTEQRWREEGAMSTCEKVSGHNNTRTHYGTNVQAVAILLGYPMAI